MSSYTNEERIKMPNEAGWVCSAAFCFAGKMPTVPKEIMLRNEMIEQQIERDRLANKKIMKILLLGGPESGKSTLFKQMRILHMNGFSDLDMVNYRYLVYSNVVQAVYQLLQGAEHLKITVDANLSVSLASRPEVLFFNASF